jgi:hypothetical protein
MLGLKWTLNEEGFDAGACQSELYLICGSDESNGLASHPYLLRH